MPGLMETRIGNSAVDSLISQDMLPCMCPQVPSASTVVGSEWGQVPDLYYGLFANALR